MRTVLVINAGSSSLKFQLFDVEGSKPRRSAHGELDGIGVHPHLRARMLPVQPSLTATILR